MIEVSSVVPKKSDIVNNVICCFALSKDEILTRDFRRLDTFIKLLKECETAARQKVMLTFSGYDHTALEIYEIRAIRLFVEKLVRKYPYFFYFLTPLQSNSSLILSCICEIQMLADTDKKSINQILALGRKDFNNRPKLVVHLSIPKVKCLNLIGDIVKYGLSIGEDEVSMKKLVATIPMLSYYYEALMPG